MNSFASSTNKYSPTDKTVDVEAVVVGDENHNHQQHQEIYASPSSSSIALIPYDGNFSSILAPLNKQSFTVVAKGVEEKLKVVNQTLGMLDNLLDSQGFDAILNEMLQSITLKTGELLNAHRSTIFLLDDEKNELFAIVAQDENGNAYVGGKSDF